MVPKCQRPFISFLKACLNTSEKFSAINLWTILFNLVVLCCPSLSLAHQYRFFHLSGADGLSQIAVQTILEDRHGAIWIGTEAGLNRYDGFGFEVFGIKEGLPNDWINALVLDRDGSLWIATNDGISRWKGDGFTNYTMTQGVSDKRAKALAVDSSGILWCGTEQGLVAWNGVEFREYSERDGIPRTGINDLLVDVHGQLWVATDRGLYYSTRGGFGHVPDRFLVVQNILKLGISRDDRLWVAVRGAVLVYQDTKLVARYALPNGRGQVDVSALYVDNTDEAWVGTGNGIARIHDATVETMTTADGLPFDDVRSIIQDNEGLIWLGGFGGVARFTGRAFTTFRDELGSIGTNVRPILRDDGGYYWVGTAKGVAKLERALPGGLRLVGEFPCGFTWALCEDSRRTIWVAHGPMLSRLDGKKLSVEARFQSGEHVVAIAEDSNKTLWCIVRSVGLFRRGAHGFERVVVPGQSFFNSRLLVDSKGKLWASGLNGISRWDGNTWRTFTALDGLADNETYFMCEDKKGNIWFGYHSSRGVSCYDGSRFRTYTTADGLVNNAVYSLGVDEQNNIWIGTPQGIDRFDGDRFINYSIAEGLSDNESNAGGFLADPDGTLWFGTANGLSHYNPKYDYSFRLPPIINIQSLALGDSLVSPESPISVPFFRNELEAHVSSLSSGKEERLKITYHLAGYEDRWRELHGNEIAYTNLPAGEYALEVLGTKQGGVASKTVTARFSIQPPFWRTWWFGLIVTLATVAAARGVYLLSVRRIRNRNKQLGNIVAARTEELRNQKARLEVMLDEQNRAQEELQHSEERYRSLFKSNPHPMWVYDVETLAFLDVNDAATTRYGYTRDEFLRMTLKDIRPDDDVPRLLENIKDSFETVQASGVWRHRKKDGSIIWVEISSHGLKYDSHDTRLVLANDITDRLQSEREIRLLAQTVASSKDCICITDLDNGFLFVNDAFVDVYGYEREELIGKNVSIILSPSVSSETPQKVFEATLQGGWYGEVINRRKDGSEFPLELWTSVVRDDAGAPVALVGVARDITERKKGEEAHNLFRALIDQSNDAIEVLDPETHRFIDANERAWSDLGYSREEFLSMTLFDVDPTVDVERFEHALRQLRESGHLEIEGVHRRKDGSVFPVEVNLRYVHLDRDYIVGAIHDITERKKTEEAVRASEERYRLLSESALTGVYLIQDKVFRYVNPMLASIFGYSVDEIIGKKGPMDLTAGEDRALVADNIRKRIDGEAAQIQYAFTGVRKDGTRIDIEVHGGKATFNGKPAIVGTLVDISERKKAEEVLRANVARGLQQASSLIALTREEVSPSDDVIAALHRITEVSAKTLNVSRVSVWRFNEQRTSINALDLYELSADRHSSGFELVASGYPAYFRALPDSDVIDANDADTDPRTCEFAEGYLRPLNISSMLDAPVRLHGVLIGVVCHEQVGSRREWTPDERTFVIAIANLVSLRLEEWERKKAEESLRAERELLRTLIDNLPDRIYAKDTRSRFLLNNAAHVQALGASRPDEVLGKTDCDFRPHDLAMQYYEDDQRVVQSGEPLHNIEQSSLLPNGEKGWFLVTKVPLRDQRGNIIGLVGISRDITERKRAEEGLWQAEEKYRGIFENAVVGIYRSTVEGRYDLVNTRLATMYGFDSPEELIAAYTDLNRQFYVKSGRRTEFMAIMKEQGGVSGFESQVYKKDRSIIWISEDAKAVRDADGTIVAFEGTTMDITERKRAEESTQRLLRAVEQTDEVVFMTDVEGAISFVNPAFERLYGFAREEVIGKTPRMLKSGKYDVSHYESLWREILSGRTVHGEYINKCKNGDLVTVEAAVSPVYNSGGELAGFIAVQRDVTKRKREEEQRKYLETQLTQAQKIESIGTLAGGIAHDFNNILGIILGHASLIEQRLNSPMKASASLDSINAAVDRGAGLVRQILTFARKTEILFEPIQLNQIIDEIVQLLEETFPRTISFATRLSSIDPLVEADRTQLHQTLLNLCVNARDAMPKGGTITLTTEEVLTADVQRRFPDACGFRYVVVSVSDTGSGIDQKTMSRIFEPFFTTKEKGKGTGLGLAVVYGIVKSHRGFIDVKSEPGRGTTFALYLPLFIRNDDEMITSPDRLETLEKGNETILVVEDEEMLLSFLESLLKSHGYTVLTADNGKRAVEMYAQRQQEIEVVLSDIGLPKMDGSNAFLKMKQINPDVKVILASGYCEPQVKADLIRSGVKSVISKPYLPKEILKQIRAALN